MKILSIEIVDENSYKNYGGLYYDDGIEVVEEVLGLDHDDIGGFQRIGTNNAVKTVNFAISNDTYYRESVQNGMNRRRVLSSGKVIIVSEPHQGETTEIWVRYIPFSWEDERIIRIFSYYGDIKELKHQRIRATETRNANYVGKRNGIIRIKIKLRKQIQSTMTVDGQKIETFYPNQVRTCFRCGGNHMRSACSPGRVQTYYNIFSLEEDFPEIQGAVKTPSARRLDGEEMEDNSEEVETPAAVTASVEETTVEPEVTPVEAGVTSVESEATSVQPEVTPVEAGNIPVEVSESVTPVVVGKTSVEVHRGDAPVSTQEIAPVTSEEAMTDGGEVTVESGSSNVVDDSVMEGGETPVVDEAMVDVASVVEVQESVIESTVAQASGDQISVEDAHELLSRITPEEKEEYLAPVIVAPADPGKGTQWRKFMDTILAVVSPDIKKLNMDSPESEANSASEAEQDHLLTPGQVQINDVNNDVNNDLDNDDDMTFFETAEAIEMVDSVVSEPQILISQDLQDQPGDQQEQRTESVKRAMESSAEEDTNNNILNPTQKKKGSNEKPVKQPKLADSSVERSPGTSSVSAETDMET